LHGDDWLYVRRSLPTVRTFYGSALDEARTATRWRRRYGQLVFFALELLASRMATTTYGLIPGDGRWYGTSGSLGCGVDIDGATAARSPHPSILFVGTWHGRKRGRLLATAFSEYVRPRLTNAELIMVSDDVPPTPGVTQVRHPTDAELRELYSQSWVFCLPSAYEGLGIPYLEAMAAGTPVLATHNPGANYLLDGGRYGELVEPSDLGRVLLELLTDSERRDRLSKLGIERATAFSWDNVCETYEAAYRDAIARWRGRIDR
jgi:glycosyltransferase involved in cell wall biosynthesis